MESSKTKSQGVTSTQLIHDPYSAPIADVGLAIQTLWASDHQEVHPCAHALPQLHPALCPSCLLCLHTLRPQPSTCVQCTCLRPSHTSLPSLPHQLPVLKQHQFSASNLTPQKATGHVCCLRAVLRQGRLCLARGAANPGLQARPSGQHEGLCGLHLSPGSILRGLACAPPVWRQALSWFQGGLGWVLNQN